VYGIDPALMQSISFASSRDLGRIYENVVFLELQRRGREIYYWKSVEGKEVDFLIRQGTTITGAIQVSVTLKEPATLQRELDALLSAAKLFPEAELTIITDDERVIQMHSLKINVIPLWKWLIIPIAAGRFNDREIRIS
jgi:predicted AAA+ superfamily ATPase